MTDVKAPAAAGNVFEGEVAAVVTRLEEEAIVQVAAAVLTMAREQQRIATIDKLSAPAHCKPPLRPHSST